MVVQPLSRLAQLPGPLAPQVGHTHGHPDPAHVQAQAHAVAIAAVLLLHLHLLQPPPPLLRLPLCKLTSTRLDPWVLTVAHWAVVESLVPSLVWQQASLHMTHSPVGCWTLLIVRDPRSDYHHLAVLLMTMLLTVTLASS